MDYYTCASVHVGVNDSLSRPKGFVKWSVRGPSTVAPSASADDIRQQSSHALSSKMDDYILYGIAAERCTHGVYEKRKTFKSVEEKITYNNVYDVTTNNNNNNIILLCAGIQGAFVPP